MKYRMAGKIINQRIFCFLILLKKYRNPCFIKTGPVPFNSFFTMVCIYYPPSNSALLSFLILARTWIPFIKGEEFFQSGVSLYLICSPVCFRSSKPLFRRLGSLQTNCRIAFAFTRPGKLPFLFHNAGFSHIQIAGLQRLPP